jgi:hypothetical protein
MNGSNDSFELRKKIINKDIICSQNSNGKAE